MGLQPCLSCPSLFPGGGTKWSSAASLDSKPEPFEAWNDWFWNRYSCTPIFESDLVKSCIDFWTQCACILDDFGGYQNKLPGTKTWWSFVLPRQFRSGTNHRSTSWGFRKLQQAAGALDASRRLTGWLEDASSTTWWCLIHLMDIVDIVFVISSQSILMSGVTLIQKVNPIGDSKCFRQIGATSPYRW